MDHSAAVILMLIALMNFTQLALIVRLLDKITCKICDTSTHRGRR